MTKSARGFTLIELLVVISIIGILTTLVAANLNSARGRARDAQRKSDLKNISTALRLYYNDKGAFPDNNSSFRIKGCGALGTTACTWGQEWKAGDTTYMSTLPRDPLPDQSYRYSFVDSDNYVISVCLENKSDDKGESAGGTTWCPSNWKYEVKP